MRSFTPVDNRESETRQVQNRVALKSIDAVCIIIERRPDSMNGTNADGKEREQSCFPRAPTLSSNGIPLESQVVTAGFICKFSGYLYRERISQ